MAAHGLKRARPAELVPGTVRVITARMDYLPRDAPDGWQAVEWQRLARPGEAVVSIYARGRDYHKVLRTRLQRLAERLAERGRPVRPPRLHRLGAGARGRAGRAQRHRLARQAHAGAAPRGAARCSSSARSSSTCALPLTAPVERALRQLQRLHRRLPDAGHRRAVPARRAALHLLPDDRARRADPGRAARARSATASTAATTASSSARGTSTRSAARCPTSTRASRSTAPRCWSCGPGARPSSCAAPKAARSAASAMQRWRRNLAVALGNALRAEAGEGLRERAAARARRRRRAGARAHRLGAAPQSRPDSAPAPAAPAAPAAARPCRAASTA